MAVKIVAIAGTLRKAALNKVVLKCAVAAAIAAGAEVEVIDLGEDNLPMVNQDLETKNEDGMLSATAAGRVRHPCNTKGRYIVTCVPRSLIAGVTPPCAQLSEEGG